MASRANKPVSVTLGPLAARAEARVKSGSYASISEVVRDGLRALDREEMMMDALLKAKVDEAMSDSRPDIPFEEVKAHMRAYAAQARAKHGR